MCNFLSAIVLRTGTVLCDPMVDSHSDLVALFNVRDNDPARSGGRQNFVRVEFTPTDSRYDDPDAYTLAVDEPETPDWFDDDMRAKTATTLRAVVSKMILRDSRELLVSGAWILGDGSGVAKAIQPRIVWAHKFATIEDAGSATIQNAGYATIGGTRHKNGKAICGGQ